MHNQTLLVSANVRGETLTVQQVRRMPGSFKRKAFWIAGTNILLLKSSFSLADRVICHKLLISLNRQLLMHHSLTSGFCLITDSKVLLICGARLRRLGLSKARKFLTRSRLGSSGISVLNSLPFHS
jgi:hypothetical protein